MDDKKLTFYCETCDVNYNTAYVNGYDVGERLMEGVMFEVKISKDNKCIECIDVDDDSYDYMKQFNMEYWIKMVNDYCNDDHEMVELSCPNCHDGVINPLYDKTSDNETENNNVPIKKTLINIIEVLSIAAKECITELEKDNKQTKKGKK